MGCSTLEGEGAGTWFGGSDLVMPSTVTANLIVTGDLPLAIVDVNVWLSATHPYVSDVSATLSSPAGTTVLLTAANGGWGANYEDTVFDDEATDSVTVGSAPFSGSWTPQEALSAFDGEDARGTWVLSLSDSYAPSDDGVLDGWSPGIGWDNGVDTDSDGSARCADCDDGEPLSLPGGDEVCDGLDNDCDPTTIEGDDADGDGVTVCTGDCDDANPAIHPDAAEACNGIDDDCDAATTEDADADGDGVEFCGGDCHDGDPTVGGSLVELCDGIDGDCDCDDADAAIGPSHPEATAELCADGIDNDCNGTADADDEICQLRESLVAAGEDNAALQAALDDATAAGCGASVAPGRGRTGLGATAIFGLLLLGARRRRAT